MGNNFFFQGLSCTNIPRITNGAIIMGERFEFEDSARIQCHPGFRSVGAESLKCLANQTLSDVAECRDIDECAEGSAVCNIQSTKCFNMPGGYHCQCLSGFQPHLCRFFSSRDQMHFSILLKVFVHFSKFC